jgi:hypothetical protein
MDTRMDTSVDVTVTITKNGDELDEDIDVKAKRKARDKKKSRDFRLKYRAAMKDPRDFPETHMADRDHPTVILSKANGDTVCFVAEFPFSLTKVEKDPKIVDDENSPDCPFTQMNGDRLVFPQVAAKQGDMFIAGKYKVADGAEIQAYYKFTVDAEKCETLDPDIVIEP